MSKKFTILSFFIFMLVGVFYGVPQDKEFDRAKRIGDQIKVLETRHWDKAVDNLVQVGEPAVEPLIKAIKDNIKFISARSCYALARIGTSRAVTAVMEALKNPQGQIMVREYAADALGYVKSDESLQLLSDILINDGAAGVRRYAAKSLGKIGSERAVGTLLKALEDKNAWVRGTAAEALGKIHSPRAAASLVELLKSESDFVRVRTRNALVEIGKPAVESLLRSLEDTNTQVRWMAVWVLGHIRSSVVVLPLIQAIGDPDWMVRDEAALALAKIKKEDAVEPLVRLLQDDRAYVRCEAAWILGKMGAKKAVDPLIQALEDKEGGWMAATALGELKSEKALKPLITALKSKNLKLRRASAWALTKIRSEQAVNPLISVLSDEDDEVRMWAALALENIGTPQKKINELILKLGTEHWEEAIVALAELGDTQTQGYVYRGIVRGLAEIGSDQAEETLIKVVGQKDLSRLIRGPAAEALGRFQSDRTIAVLVKTLNDKDEFVRNFAGGALAKIGSKKAMEALFEGLRKNLGFLMNPFVREALEKDKS
ncbi:MAG: HEAT repeat domain-containing protein, partial [Candidatus Aminicenantes bacterium]